MKPTTVLFFFSIFFSSQVFAWTVKADFEKGVIGTVASSTEDAFHGTSKNSKYVNSPALSGSQSASVTAIKGETGFGSWGGSFGFPSKLREGDQIWYRTNVYYPSGWDFSCGGCTQGLKFMRIHTQKAGGGNNSNEGYNTILIKGSKSGGLITVDSELQTGFYTNNTGNTLGKGTAVIRDQWHTYEMSIKFSSIPGQGIYRVWQDGALIFEDLKTPTLRSASSESNTALLYTYWNNGAPKTQTSYVDDIIITSEIPGKKDAYGNPFIGVGPSIYIAPPNSPPGGGASGK